MAFSEADLAEMKRLHQANVLTLDEIAEQFGIAATTVSKIARTHGWPSRSELKGRAARSFRRVSAQAEARLLRQLYDTTLRMLAQMEAEMAGGNLGTQDIERAAKAVAAMVGSVGKVTMAGPDGDTTQTPDADESRDSAANVERLKREIIERFESIQRRRNAEGGSG